MLKASRLLRFMSERVERARRRPARVRRLITLLRALLSQRGEVSGARLAAEALLAYESLEPGEVDALFDSLAADFSPDPAEVRRASDAYSRDASPQNLRRLQRVVEPERQELFRRLNLAPGGTAKIVALRQRVLEGLAEHPGWTALDADLLHLLSSWFNRGFLVLRRIDWRTSASILEKLIQYEAVHAIHSWRDLRRRLQADRRCYAFFHPALPDEPVIFVEVALTRGMSATVQPLLDHESPVGDPLAANCAIFYSITNCQKGLRGVSFGSFLLKIVVEDLGRELPRIKTFATLSPIPTFRKWLADIAKTSPDIGALTSVLAEIDASGTALHKTPAKVRVELTQLCAYYFLHAKSDNQPLDPVARFHLNNGASLERLNWASDVSSTGISRSAGLTVNYVYRLSDVENNHERYARDYRVIASGTIKRLARHCSLSAGNERVVVDSL
jgi:malonyl-CoA decarboxylase